MRYVAISICLVLGCQPLANTPARSPAGMRASTVFTDSALFRARCKEADSIVKLTVIPQKCTPRDQRVEIR
jgi:hypothetical protein